MTPIKEMKKPTNFEPSNDEDVINKGFLDKTLPKLEAPISKIQEDYNEIKILSNKQSVEEVLVRRAVKRTIQSLYDKELFDGFPKADVVLKKKFPCSKT